MKRTLSLALAAVFAAAVLASCAVPAATDGATLSASANPRITVTSSDGEDSAAWLTERLGDSLTDRIVLGTSADGYGIDLTALEDDGYVIRSIGDEIAVFARTTDGLDMAVRKYAKTVEAGEAISDVTYHEGYRIEELRLAGVPVAEYAIAVEGENEYVRNWVTANAAEPFAELVKIACGAELSVGGEADHKIVFRQIADEGFKESSYHYYFADGDLVFEYTDLGGARNAFVKFFENECGWEDLYYGIDVLREADLVDVSASTDVLCHPRFGGILHSTLFQIHDKSTLSDVSDAAFRYSFRIPDASHNLGRVWGKYFGVDAKGHRVCMTDDYTFEYIAE